MVSSDCTGAAPICARAFIAGAAASRSCGGFAGFRRDCFWRSYAPLAACVSAVCALPASPPSNAIENTDAPNKRARDILAPSAIKPQPRYPLLGLAGGRRVTRELLAGYHILDAGLSPASHHTWLRGRFRVVKNRIRHFISIVNCHSWIAAHRTCTN